MAIQTLIQRFDGSYPVSKTIAPQNGGHTDFRDYCNNVSEFDTFLSEFGQEIRQEGLITFEISTGKRKQCKKNGSNWQWDIIPTMPEVIAKIQEMIEGLGGSGGDGHSHSNKNALDSITSEKITTWDNKSDSNHNHDSVYVKLSEYNTLKSTVQNQATTITQLTNLLNDAIARIEALENSQPQPQEVPICGDSTICSNDLIVGGTQLKAFSQEPIIEVKSALSEEFLKKYAK